jgi:hypothetical protein
MEMAECKTSLKSQCPCDWLRTHVKTIGEKQSITIWVIYHVKGGGIRPMTFTIVYLL